MKSPVTELLLLLLLVLSSSSSMVLAQIGVDICACSPSTYTFTFDFSLTCLPVNITTNDDGAIQDISCLVSPFGDPAVTDLVPVAVQTIDILELGQDLRVLNTENIAGDFKDGDDFTYTSIADDPNNIPTTMDFPRALQLNIVGMNSNKDQIINVYIITFTNNCGAYPVLQEGDSAGWTIVSDVSPPLQAFCPLLDLEPDDQPTTPNPSPTPSSSYPKQNKKLIVMYGFNLIFIMCSLLL